MLVCIKLIKFEKLAQYFQNYQSRIATLNTLFGAFDKETTDIVEMLKVTTFHTIASEQLFILMIAKLEILRKEAHFIVFGVKSFKYHKNDDSPLFVPHAAPMKVLTDVNAYSAISSEYLRVQLKFMSEKLQPGKNKNAFEVIELSFDNEDKKMQSIYNQIIYKEQEIVGLFKSVKALRDSFANGKLCLIYFKIVY